MPRHTENRPKPLWSQCQCPSLLHTIFKKFFHYKLQNILIYPTVLSSLFGPLLIIISSLSTLISLSFRWMWGDAAVDDCPCSGSALSSVFPIHRAHLVLCHCAMYFSGRFNEKWHERHGKQQSESKSLHNNRNAQWKRCEKCNKTVIFCCGY